MGDGKCSTCPKVGGALHPPHSPQRVRRLWAQARGGGGAMGPEARAPLTLLPAPPFPGGSALPASPRAAVHGSTEPPPGRCKGRKASPLAARPPGAGEAEGASTRRALGALPLAPGGRAQSRCVLLGPWSLRPSAPHPGSQTRRPEAPRCAPPRTTAGGRKKPGRLSDPLLPILPPHRSPAHAQTGLPGGSHCDQPPPPPPAHLPGPPGVQVTSLCPAQRRPRARPSRGRYGGQGAVPPCTTPRLLPGAHVRHACARPGPRAQPLCPLWAGKDHPSPGSKGRATGSREPPTSKNSETRLPSRKRGFIEIHRAGQSLPSEATSQEPGDAAAQSARAETSGAGAWLGRGRGSFWKHPEAHAPPEISPSGKRGAGQETHGRPEAARPGLAASGWRGESSGRQGRAGQAARWRPGRRAALGRRAWHGSQALSRVSGSRTRRAAGSSWGPRRPAGPRRRRRPAPYSCWRRS